MKSNGILTNGGSLLREHSQAYAELLARYVREYKSGSISRFQPSPFPTNRSEAELSVTVWSGEDMRDLIRDYLGPTFRKEGLPTRVIIPENSTWDHLALWADVNISRPWRKEGRQHHRRPSV